MNPGHEIDRLRAEGYVIEVRQYRQYGEGEGSLLLTRNEMNTMGNMRIQMANVRGGKTTVQITAPDGKWGATGEAICRPDEQYNRKLGLEVALGRAMKQMGLLHQGAAA